MSALSKRVALIEHRFGAEAAAAWRKYHIGAQVARLVSGIVGTVVLAVVHGGVTDWTSLVPVVTGALWAGLAEIAPGVPWSLLRDRFHLGNQPPTPASGGESG